MREFVKRILEIYRPFRKPMLMVFVFIILDQIFILLGPYIQGKIVDKIFSKAPIMDVFFLALLSLALFFINTIVSGFFRERFELENIDFDIPKFISIKVTMAKIFSFSIGQHCNQNSGVKQSIIDKGENSLTNLTNMVLYNALPMLVSLVFTVIVLLYMSTVLGLVTLIGSVCFLVISFYLNYSMKDELKKFQDAGHDSNKVHSEIFRNICMVQINAQEKGVTEKLDQKIGEFGDLGKKVWKKYVFWACLRSIIIGITRFLVLVISVIYVYKDIHTAGQLVMFIAWSSSAFGRIGQIGNLHRKGTEMYIAVKKFFSLLDIEPEIKEINNPVKIKKPKGEIIFDNVSFKYPIRKSLEDDDKKEQTEVSSESEQETLSNVSLTIKSGQKVAFVGPSGAGKTTVANLILRAYDPTNGKILIDGSDLRVVELESYRESIGVVEQDVSLFDDTLRYNIVFGLEGKDINITEAELGDIAHASCVDKFFHRLENGFDTVIGERGVKLSGGERQRVGIARALAKNPKVLIFDEATSSLDTENETVIRKSIEKASKGRTTIIIAHRLSTIKNADKIFVMENGKIVGEGTHRELLTNCVVYQNLVNSQI